MSEPIYITFLNYLGGMEYFFFHKENEYNLNMQETGETRTNLLPAWPNAWGETADTVDRTTYRKAKKGMRIKSQYLNANQREVLQYIKTSPVVQIVYSRTNRRTIMIDSDSYMVFNESEKFATIQFSFVFTDDVATQK